MKAARIGWFDHDHVIVFVYSAMSWSDRFFAGTFLDDVEFQAPCLQADDAGDVTAIH